MSGVGVGAGSVGTANGRACFKADLKMPSHPRRTRLPYPALHIYRVPPLPPLPALPSSPTPLPSCLQERVDAHDC